MWVGLRCLLRSVTYGLVGLKNHNFQRCVIVEWSLGKNENLSDIEKISYPLSYLTEKVAKTVKSLTLSSSNYNEVRYILTEIFSDKQILISNHMNKFLNLHSGSNNNLYLRQLKPQFLNTSFSVTRSHHAFCINNVASNVMYNIFV